MVKVDDLLLNSLKKLAACECHKDDDGMDILETVGTSMDDAYNIGYNDGQVMLARRLVDMLTQP